MVTGLDIVALQFLVANGQRLPFSQNDVQLLGHAIEARVNAEDPGDGRFTPTSGPINRFHTAGGPWARTDAGYEAGDSVSQYYDNLVAKVVAWGPDRESARLRLLRALSETDVEGVPTTIPAHQRVLSHPDFVAVRHSTTWLSQSVDLAGITKPPSAPQHEASRQEVEVEVDGRHYQVSVWLPTGAAHHPPAPPLHSARKWDRPVHLPPGEGAREGQVTVPMQGTVVKVLVKTGDKIEAGQAVCVLEAMKMENNIVSQFSGTVTEVRVEPGSAVGTGDVIVVVVPEA